MRAIPVKTIELKGILRVHLGYLPSWRETNESNELKRTVRVSEIPTKKSNKKESSERSRC